MAEKRFSQRALSNALKKLADEVVDVDPNDGSPITRAEQLARLLWAKALGGETQIRDDEGNLKTVVMKPEAWAMQYVVERMEGRVPTALPEQTDGLKAADRVRDLVRERLNQRAKTFAGPPEHKTKK